jgi:hypothetical protein
MGTPEYMILIGHFSFIYTAGILGKLRIVRQWDALKLHTAKGKLKTSLKEIKAAIFPKSLCPVAKWIVHTRKVWWWRIAEVFRLPSLPTDT